MSLLKKAYTLHFDAMLVMGLVFVVSFGFNLYQKSQYSELLQQYVDEKWKSADLESQIEHLKKSQKLPETDTNQH